ncbi:kelch domain-containing protein 7A [Serinus canaria]|uniref:kelch domain-containing protein 7A n=1 Tax=Serinus canaria TaxID=9135 RepID=UPI0021CC80D4|nr:kelch domain-containing protein 7A [Serinus canaria]
MPQRVPPAWHSDMQLPGKLLLSAAALLLLSLAFRFYRNRSPPPGKIPPGEQRENRDGDGDGALRKRSRRDGWDKSGNGPGMRHAALGGEQSFPRNEEEEGEEVDSELIPRKAPLGPARMERELGRKLGWKLGIKSEGEAGVELGSDPGSRTGSELGKEPGSRLGIKPGNNPGRKPGSEPGSKLITKPGNESGSEQTRELGHKLGNKLGIESGIELGNEPGSKLDSKAGIEVGTELGSEPGNKLGMEVGSEPGMSLGSDLGSHDPGAVAGGRDSPAGKDASAPSSRRSPGIPDARTEGDGCAQSTEQDPAGAGRSRENSTGTVRTLSVTSSLGLLLTASEAGSDTSYCFSSVAKIQVEENFIPERRDKDRDSSPRPGLRGKVYDYFVQSTSESVSRRTSLPFVPAGTSQCHGEQGQAEPWSPGTQGENPALETPDPDPSSAPQEGTESPPEPPSPDRKSSTPGISPQLPLPGGVPAAGPEPCQVSPPGQVHLGNCSEVLRAAKAQQLRALQDAALQVMSDHLLQVLRSPAIYGRLNAGERELLPALRSRGRPRLVVADVPPAEPGHRRGRLCYYDEDGDRWCQLCQLPAEVAGRGCAVCSMFNYLFVVPGWEGAGPERSPSRRVLCYDPLGDSWRDICPLRQARPHCQLVALDGHLYAIGGECLATMERYDPRRDRWAFAAALPRDTFAVAHAATACDGDIYVTGGTLRSLLLRYDTRGDSWAASPAVGDKDRTAELVSAHGFLYRFQLRRGVGGTEVAVSRCSASARLWYRCGSHPLPEPAGLRCAALGGLVHCLGRGFHLRFLADPVSPRFGAKELRPFPAPHGSLLPSVLVLPEGGTEPPRP